MAEAIAQLYVDMLRGMPGHSEGAVSIVQAAGQGDLQAVKDWVKNNPDKVKHNYCDFLFLSLSLSLSLSAIVKYYKNISPPISLSLIIIVK